MARKIKKIADALGAVVIAKIPKTGGGAFGAARIGRAEFFDPLILIEPESE